MSSDPAPGEAAQAPIRQARLRRRPKYGVFVATGVVLGALADVVITLLRPGHGSAGVFGYLLVTFGAFGALLGGLVAVLAAIRLDRRERSKDGSRAPL